MDPKPPPPLPRRALIGLLTAAITGGFIMMVWSFLGFGIAASLRGVKSETVGYSTILVAPAGAFAAAITAFIAALPPHGKRPWLRWIVVPAVYLVIGVVVFALLARG